MLIYVVFFAHISATNSRFIIMSMEADLKGFSKIMGQEWVTGQFFCGSPHVWSVF